jgi:hypothetical protein
MGEIIFGLVVCGFFWMFRERDVIVDDELEQVREVSFKLNPSDCRGKL